MVPYIETWPFVAGRLSQDDVDEYVNILNDMIFDLDGESMAWLDARHFIGT
jgi:hypothetical protein